MVDISQFAEFAEPRQQSLGLPLPRFPLDGHHDRVLYPDAGDGMDFDIGGDHLDAVGEEFSGAEEWYEGAGTCYSRDSTTLLDLFDTDEYADCRKDNLFYPFASRNEWEVADFLLRSSLSMAAINEFLALSMVCDLLCSRFEALQSILKSLSFSSPSYCYDWRSLYEQRRNQNH
ncbi:hypothetical protein DFH29DRAFT_1008510 [Suillus ampliporus]|nr:hypothetical protein DFH29DRAFT_1008510 [Suillus ampliporus]